MYPKSYSQCVPFGWLQTGVEGFYRLYDSQTRMDSSEGIIFMCLGIAKIDQETIAQELGNVSVKTLDNFSTCRLIGTYHVSVHFGIELT